jgi:DNA primase catalytic core
MTDFIQQIRNVADIRLLCEGLTELTGNGNRLTGRCPFHSEQDASFTVYPDQGSWHCFGCGKGGSAFDLVMMSQGLEFFDAAKQLAEKFNIPIPELSPEQQEAHEKEQRACDVLDKYMFEAQKKLSRAKKALEYVRSRGITAESIEKYGIGLGPAFDESKLKPAMIKGLESAGLVTDGKFGRWWPMKDRLLFPIVRNGHAIQISGRAIDDKKPKYLDLKRDKYPWQSHLMRGEQCIFVEGVIDGILVSQAGFPACATISTYFQPQWVDLVGKSTRCYCCYDMDDAGAGSQASDKISAMLYDAAREVYIISLPKGFDPASYIVQHGGVAFGGLVESALPYIEFLIQSMPEGMTEHDRDNRLQHIASKLATASESSIEDYSKKIASQLRLSVTNVKKDLRKFITQVRRKTQSKEAAPLKPGSVTVESVLPTAPVDKGAVLPCGWKVDEHGVRQLVEKVTQYGVDIAEVPVSPSPILITTRLEDVVDGDENLEIAWLRDGRWKRITESRATIASSRSLVQLAGSGLTVTSETARGLVNYFAAYENANIANLKRAYVSSVLGWQKKQGFLWGRQLICPDGSRAHGDSGIRFRGKDGGDERLADGYRPEGSYDEWLRLMEMVVPYPRVLLALYASLCAPLLTVFGCSNFVVDWANPTSTGKTTTLRVAGSAWGNPDEKSADAVINGWDCTRVWIERAASTLNGIPLILDDTKRAKLASDVSKVLYDFTSGQGRGRGSIAGIRDRGNWRTVMLSSGESKATDFSQDGGTVARTLEVWGKPFGRADETSAPMVGKLNMGLKQHFGHAGPRLVEFVLKNKDQWSEWKAEYQSVLASYVERAGANEVAIRYSEYFALMDITAALAGSALELPWGYADPIAALWDDLTAESGTADRAKQALLYVWSWAQANYSQFYGRQEHNSLGHVIVPHAGWAGIWEREEVWDSLNFFTHRLTALLEAQKYEPDAIIRTWKDRGWLNTNEGKYTRRMRFEGRLTLFYSVQRSALESLDTGLL